MVAEQRKDERFIDVGRVEAPELCIFPGVLEDISLLGGRIRFPQVLDMNPTMEINLKISLSRAESPEPILLIGCPKWWKKDESSTLIGFKFLRSPSTNSLNSYIEKLTLANEEFEEEDLLLCSVM